MRLLLDESFPVELAGLIVGQDVMTVRGMKWTGVKNGLLLRMAAAEGFDALITPDKSIEFQQNIARLPLAVILLRAKTNRVQDLAPLLPELLDLLQTVEPCSFRRVGT